MNDTFDLIVSGGILVSPSGQQRADIGLRGDRIVAIGDLADAQSTDTIDASGQHVLPGVIDSQVHFRDPGLTHKEDLETGTRGAIAGGVTAICEMPNTSPATTNVEALQFKLDRAAKVAYCDYAFFAGAAADNPDALRAMQALKGCAGIKIFMGSSTGSLLVSDDKDIRTVLEVAYRRCAIHCEDEPRLIERAPLREGPEGVHLHPVWRDVETALRATQRLVTLAIELDRAVHVLHITTEEEIAYLAEMKPKGRITVECTPQHLTLAAPECYDELGTLAQMNPPVREVRHREALWRGIEAGVVDVIGSDHAPHTKEEKARDYPQTPSGMTGVQTLVPIMLDHVSKGRLSLERMVELTAANPARIYNMSDLGSIDIGRRANLTIVDMNREVEIRDDWIESRSGWTPFHGKKVQGWPTATIVGGQIAMRDGSLYSVPTSPIQYEQPKS